MARLENKSKQNPKLMQTPLKDGRISLYLEYYLGRSETPVLDEDGNQVYYTDGAMAGKPKYKVKHARKKEILNLYLWESPKDQQQRIQNKNTIALAEKTRFEREQKFLEDREGYKFKRDTKFNFLDYFQQKMKESKLSKSYISGMKCAYDRFVRFLAETPKYSVYSSYIRPEQLTPEMMIDYSEFLSDNGKGRGPQTIFNRFKRILNMMVDEGIITKSPAQKVFIKADRDPLTKEILSPEEIEILVSTHYPGENHNTQRAFILTLFTGIRFCDVSRLTYSCIDYSTKTMRFIQHKTKGRSSKAHVVTPLNDSLIGIIGYPPEGATGETLIFDLPSYHTCKDTLSTWVRNSGIKKHISWHSGRHSFAVNALNAGANIKTVSSLLGHSSLAMTEKYLHVVDSLKSQAIDSLGTVSYTKKYTHVVSKEERKRMSENCRGGVPARKKKQNGTTPSDEEIAV